MGRLSAQDWEFVVDRDLLPLLGLGIGSQSRRAQWPADPALLPDEAYQDLSVTVGRLGMEDVLAIPPAARLVDRLRYRSLYVPLQVAAIGDRAVGLWVRALPTPGVRVQVPVSRISAIETLADGPQRLLVVTGEASSLAVRYTSDDDASVDAWARRIRMRAAGDPSPVPAMPSARYGKGLDEFLFGPADGGVCVRWRSGFDYGQCTLAITSRELIVARSWVRPGRPWRKVRRTFYAPRRSIEGIRSRSRSVCLDSAGAQNWVGLGSKRIASAASAWLGQVLGQADHRGDDARPRQTG
jgi:hypothetical protein